MATGSGSDAPTLDLVRGGGPGLAVAAVTLPLSLAPTFHIFLVSLNNVNNIYTG